TGDGARSLVTSCVAAQPAGNARPMAIEDPSAYRERRPPAELTDHVTNLWVREVPHAAPATVRVLPDGRADLMWLQDGNIVTTLVAGPDSRVQFTELTPG